MEKISVLNNGSYTEFFGDVISQYISVYLYLCDSGDLACEMFKPVYTHRRNQ